MAKELGLALLPRAVSVQCGQAGAWGSGGVRETGREGEGEGKGREKKTFRKSIPRRRAVRLNGKGDGTGSSPRPVSVQCGRAGY